MADGRVDGRLALLCLCDWRWPLDPCLSCWIKVHGGVGPFYCLGEGKGKLLFDVKSDRASVLLRNHRVPYAPLTPF